MYGLLEAADYQSSYRMTTLKKAHAAWKRRVSSFERSLNQIKAAYTNGAITDVEHGEQQLREANLTWNSLEEAYAMFEVDYPEPENLELEQPEDAGVYQERMELFKRALDAETTFSLEANRVIANLRMVAPAGARG